MSAASGDRRLRAGAIVVFLLDVVANVAYVLVSRGLGREFPGLTHVDGLEVSQIFATMGMGCVGLLLSWHRPRNPAGWLLGGSALMLALSDAGQLYGERSVAFPGEHLPAAIWVLALSAPLWIPAVFVPASLLLVRYPSGELSGRWPRRFDRAVWTGLALGYVGYALSPEAVTDEVVGKRLPFEVPEQVLAPWAIVVVTLIMGGTLLIVGDAVRRTVRGPREERVALLLLLGTSVTSMVTIFFVGGPLVGVVAFASMLLAISVGVLRYNAFGIDVVTRRVLVYGALTFLVFVAFVGIVAGLALVVPGGPLPQLVAAAVIAIGLGPARDRLQTGIDRLLYGDRDDPVAAIQRLGGSLGEAELEAVVPGVLAALATALRLDRVALDGPPGAVSVPLVFGGQQLGELNAWPRRGEGSLSRADVSLLQSVAPMVSAVVHAVGSASDLERERARVVEATLAERDRLRSDLHDGLGPALTGIGLGIEAAQRSGATEELLARIRHEVASSLVEVRRIIDDLAPQALDGADLLSALRSRTDQVNRAGVVQVELVTPRRLPELPTSVAAAAYRITDEALTNVVRHAAAQRCRVEVRVGPDLQLEVSDDGVGPVNGAAHAGVGLRSMRERAERLGGSFRLDPTPPGTRVCVRLPLVAT